MFISKFDLYKSEWLELVFDDRNKAYGAYELRQHYSRTLLKAMGFAFVSIIVAFVIIGMLIKPVIDHIPVQKITSVNLTNLVYPAVVKPPKPLTHIREHLQPPAPAIAVATHQSVPLVLADDSKSKEPIKAAVIATSAIGPDELKGATTTNSSGGGGGTAPGTGVTPGTGNDVYEAMGLERMPEPIGGASAWAKFIQKHLKYPDQALDGKMQGRVIVSFIVEKDGRLTNFVVVRGPGYGMDEEALRVLKLAPAWKPGIQNGQPVRVQYDIPINFQMDDGN